MVVNGPYLCNTFDFNLPDLKSTDTKSWDILCMESTNPIFFIMFLMTSTEEEYFSQTNNYFVLLPKSFVQPVVLQEQTTSPTLNESSYLD